MHPDEFRIIYCMVLVRLRTVQNDQLPAVCDDGAMICRDGKPAAADVHKQIARVRIAGAVNSIVFICIIITAGCHIEQHAACLLGRALKI